MVCTDVSVYFCPGLIAIGMNAYNYCGFYNYTHPLTDCSSFANSALAPYQLKMIMEDIRFDSNYSHTNDSLPHQTSLMLHCIISPTLQ